MEKINYTLTLEDCTHFVHSQFKIPRLKKYFFNTLFKRYSISALVVIFLYGIFFGFLIFDGCAKNNLTLSAVIKNANFTYFLSIYLQIAFIGFLIFTLVAITFFIAEFYFIGGKNVYKSLKGIDLNYELSISNENIIRTNKNGTMITNWKTVKDIYDTKHNYLIFTSDLQAIIIPKRAFENEEKSQEFYRLIKSYYNITT